MKWTILKRLKSQWFHLFLELFIESFNQKVRKVAVFETTFFIAFRRWLYTERVGFFLSLDVDDGARMGHGTLVRFVKCFCLSSLLGFIPTLFPNESFLAIAGKDLLGGCFPTIGD